jgi:hypothetical protein
MKNVTQKSPCLKLKFHAQRETVTQIILRAPNGGRPKGAHGNLKATKKAKPALLDEFTRLTGYYRKPAVRVLSRKPVWEVLVCGNGTAVKFKPEKKRPANRKGKRIYTGEVIASLRLV